VGPQNSQLDLLMAFFIFSNENEVDFLPFFFNLKNKFLDANRNPKSPSFAIRNHLLHSFLTLSLARGPSYSNNKEIVCGFVSKFLFYLVSRFILCLLSKLADFFVLLVCNMQISVLFGEQIFFFFCSIHGFSKCCFIYP
jgi:hypothetical protein